MLETNSSHLINRILKILDKQGAFEKLGRGLSHSMVLQILNLAQDYDGDRDVILDGVGESLGICKRCGKAVDHLVKGICRLCVVNGGCQCDEEPIQQTGSGGSK